MYRAQVLRNVAVGMVFFCSLFSSSLFGAWGPLGAGAKDYNRFLSSNLPVYMNTAVAERNDIEVELEGLSEFGPIELMRKYIIKDHEEKGALDGTGYRGSHTFMGYASSNAKLSFTWSGEGMSQTVKLGAGRVLVTGSREPTMDEIWNYDESDDDDGYGFPPNKKVTMVVEIKVIDNLNLKLTAVNRDAKGRAIGVAYGPTRAIIVTIVSVFIQDEE